LSFVAYLATLMTNINGEARGGVRRAANIHALNAANPIVAGTRPPATTTRKAAIPNLNNHGGQADKTLMPSYLSGHGVG
jgi:hypothetical protein